MNFTIQNQGQIQWNMCGDVLKAVHSTSINNALHSQGIMDNNKIELNAHVVMWLCVKCPCRSLYQLLHWQTLRLSLLCTCLFCICYILYKLLVTDCPKLLCLKALNSLDLLKRMRAFWKKKEFLRWAELTTPLQNSHLFPCIMKIPTSKLSVYF